MQKILALLWLSGAFGALSAQTPSDRIRLNQLGFYPQAPKVAIVAGQALRGPFFLKSTTTGKVVFTGALGDTLRHPFSGRVNTVADFSGFRKTGAYYLEIPSVGASYPFEIRRDIHRPVAAAALKGFYYQRTAVDLPARYAGAWARPAGHPDTAVYIHASAATPQQPEGSRISAPLGWYDAGDYNKYIVNSGITVATLLSLYEDFPEARRQIRCDIPESSNTLPDVLDEALFNLRWMLCMQDPNDGGVYHKLTNAAFDPLNAMPHTVNTPRYVVQKSVTATLDFAAVMAQASRVFRKFDKKLPHFADSCRLAAEKAWQWAQANPQALYKQEELNRRFEPDINTGAYGDGNSSDEWIWAAIELWTTTGDPHYKDAVSLFPDERLPLPAWNQVRSLGYYTWLRLQGQLPAASTETAQLKARLLREADALLTGWSRQPWRTVMGQVPGDYVWGSSAVAANQGILLLQAYRHSGNKTYLLAALGNLDYLLGRNATGYCFLTGFGQKQVLHPHHRPSVADGVALPVPGLLSGGPNPGQQDKCPGYPSRIADESFLDADCSYASNEIAINWNAPLVYLAAALEWYQGDFTTRRR